MQTEDSIIFEPGDIRKEVKMKSRTLRKRTNLVFEMLGIQDIADSGVVDIEFTTQISDIEQSIKSAIADNLFINIVSVDISRNSINKGYDVRVKYIQNRTTSEKDSNVLDIVKSEINKRKSTDRSIYVDRVGWRGETKQTVADILPDIGLTDSVAATNVTYTFTVAEDSIKRTKISKDIEINNINGDEVELIINQEIPNTIGSISGQNFLKKQVSKVLQAQDTHDEDLLQNIFIASGENIINIFTDDSLIQARRKPFKFDKTRASQIFDSLRGYSLSVQQVEIVKLDAI